MSVVGSDTNFAGTTSPVLNQVVAGPGTCDVYQDGTVDVCDVNLIPMIPMVYCVTVQIAIDAVLELGCAIKRGRRRMPPAI